MYAKAIAAFIVPLLVAPLAVIGITPDTPIEVALVIIIVALIDAVAVYFIPNKGYNK